MGLSLLLAAFLALPAFSQDGGASLACFRGLNDADSPAVLNPCDSPDLLNTESNLEGTAVLKRRGFSKVADLPVSTAPVTGSHSFIDSNGNRKDIVCQERLCAASTNGNAFAVFYGTGAAGITRWSWVDVGGAAYGANNKYDKILKYDGSSTSNPMGMPLGSILELTPDRLSVSDISGSPNRVHLSSTGAYEQFTLGVNPEDSYFDEIGAPGDKIRGARCLNGVCYFFKTASITACEMGDQYTTRCSVISPNIGTTDPGSILAAGSCLYFRSQDKTYWELCDGLRDISKKIPNFVKSQSGGLAGGEQLNTQTTQADWENGSERPSGTYDTTTIPGAIFPSSITFVDTSSAQFAAGSIPSALTNTTTDGSLQFSSASHRIYNGDFEQGTCASGVYWTCATNGSADCSFSAGSAIDGSCGASIRTTVSGTNLNTEVRILNGNNDAELYDITLNDDPAVGTGYTINLGALGLSTQTLKIQFFAMADGNSATLTSSTFTAISTISWSGVQAFGAQGWSSLDGIRVNRYFSIDQASATPAQFTSQIFDTGFSTVVGGPFTVGFTTMSGSGLPFQLQSSNDLADWNAHVSISSGDRITQARRYQRYISTFTTSVGTFTPVLNLVSLPYATTGFFRTQCIQPNASISAWGILSCAETLSGGGAFVYYATSAVTCATLPLSDPGSWQTSVSNNATLSIATNTAVYIGWRDVLTSSTDTARIDACVLAWNEGTPSQPVWSVYDSVGNSIYWTTSVDASSTTNRLLKYDRNLESWYPFSIPALAPRMISNSLYFGGASSGTWNQYGMVDADLGSPINAYWRSKDFGSDRPFNEKVFKTLSILSRNNGSGTMDATWALSNAKTGTYSVSLSTGSGISYARSNYNLPFSSPQQFINVQVGNNSSTPFEVLGLGVTWEIKPWRVSGP